MKVKKYESESAWLEDRRGCITGTKLHDVLVKRGTGRKIGFYQLIADRIAVSPDEENVMERGHRLEVEAIGEVQKQYDYQFITDLVMWMHDDNPLMAYSPDGYTKDLTRAVEIKCLSSAKHIQSIVEGKIPDEYREQVIQAFVVNDKLHYLYFGLYDPRVPAYPLNVIIFNRAGLQDEIEFCRDYEKTMLQEVDEWTAKLAF